MILQEPYHVALMQTESAMCEVKSQLMLISNRMLKMFRGDYVYWQTTEMLHLLFRVHCIKLGALLLNCRNSLVVIQFINGGENL